MKIPITISKILANKYFLYFVSFLSLTNVIGYMMMGNMDNVIIFILVGLIMTYFSKNMAIILLVSLVATNLFSVLLISKEGFDNKDNKNKNKDNNENKNKDNKNTKKDDSSHLDSAPPDESRDESPDESPDESIPSADSANQSGFEVGRGKRNSKIDYASTITDAYSQLNELIGKDGIKSLTNDTQTLMKQQLQLADSMKAIGPLIQGITPLLSQAKGMLGGLDAKSLEGISSLAKQFNVGGN